ncbi:hypothetical protein L1049_011186 [Liquidambar formosana]|uniref:Uncharacterized protein n=1 Tax=Liquidambar formosana TaxID=63359 RepID=A0AAP0RWA2_LIQFO
MLVLIASLHSFRPPPCTTGSFTCETPSNLQYAVLYAALALAAIGLGGTRFTLATMGANQFDKADHRGIFFNWFFLSLYMANVISLTAIIYIQDNVSWAIGFGICIVANVIGLAVFLLGKRFYRHIKPGGSPFTSIARVIVASLRKRKMLGNFDSQDYYHGSSGTSKMPYRTPTESFRFLNSAALKTEPDKVSDGSYAKSWRLCTVEEVEDLKTLIKIIPVWSTGIFLYAPVGIFSSLTTLQALSMDRHLGPHFQIPAGSFLVFNQLATAISILIIDRFLIPTWQNVTRRSLTLLQRVGIGHIISIVGMVGSALVETRRLHVVRTHHLMSQSGSVVPISALWLVMSLTIIGISEGFHFPGQVALYYQEFPTLLKSTSTAMVSLLIGIGFYLSTAVINLVRRITGWLPDNINDGRIDNVYWMLAVVGVVNFGYFLACAKLYKYQNVDKDDGPSGPSNSDLRHSLFDEDEDDLDFEDQQGGSIIDLMKNSEEEGEDSRLEDEIDHIVVLMLVLAGTVMGLWLTSGGWVSNLLVFLITELHVKSINATQIYNVVLGCINFFPIAGAILTDSFLSSFFVISIFAFVSLLGVIMLTLMATIPSLRPSPCATGSYTCETPSKLQFAVLYVALALATLGHAGTRFTMATMGADQFDKSKDQAIFFNWFFLTLYITNAISFTAIVYIQDNVSWGLGFGICIVANAIGLAVFLLGKHFYRHIKPKGSPFTSIARVMVAAIRKRKMSRTFDGQDYYHGSNVMSPTKSLRFLNSAALKTDDDTRSDGSYAKSWKLCTVEEVEDLKTLIKIIPMWSTGIFLSTPIGIFSSLTTLQALSMDRHLGPHFQIPAGSFLVFNFLATIISILIIDRFFIPTWQTVTRRPLTLLQRIGIGHVIDILGFVGSALVEIKRLHVVHTHHLEDQPGRVVPMSAQWLVVPLVVIGIGEGFHFPGQVALYYQEFPTSLRSTSTAMVSLLIAVGLYLTTAIIDLVRRITGWLPDNINDGRLDNVFWMLSVIGVVNFGYYLACAKLFKYQNAEKNNGPSGPAN